MNLHQFCQELDFTPDVEKQLFPHWEELWANSSEKIPEFMTAPFYEKYLPLCGIDSVLEQDILQRMHQVEEIIADCPICARLASMIHYAVFLAPPAIATRFLPLPEKFFGENAGIFQLMCALSSLPLIADRHREIGLPGKYLPAAANWLAGTVQIYQAAHQGIPGFTLQQMGWLRLDIDGVLFRIGRLEYLLENWRQDLPAIYRHRKTGELAVLCNGRWKMSSRGEYLLPTARDYDWTTWLQELDGKITGIPIDDEGLPLRDQPRTLSLDEWRPAVTPWDQIVSIHIPGGGGMTMDAVRSSLQEAVKFFRTYFKTDIKVFICHSWILNPAWLTELPNSNMAKLIRNSHRLPPLPSAHCGLFFVYGINEGDPRKLPCTNSLHRAFRRIYDRGEMLQYGGMFLLPEEIDAFGRS